MTPAHTTALADLLARDAGMVCKYEPGPGGGFVWAFYKGAKFIKRIRKQEAVLPAAERLAK